MADFFYVRHGESENNTLMADLYFNRNVFEKKRSANPVLTETGHQQAKLLANRFLQNIYVNSPSGKNTLVKDLEEQKPDIFDAIFTHGVDEIWTSYLLRAVDTAAAIQAGLSDGIKERKITLNDGRTLMSVPKIHVDSVLGEIGGKYHYDEKADSFVAIPGHTNTDLRKARPDAKFGDMLPENENEGWYKLKVPETHAQGVERCRLTLEKMENYVSCLPTGSPRKVVVVITHGDFFRNMIKYLVDNACKEGSRRILRGVIADFDTKSIVQNTSISHFAVDAAEDNDVKGKDEEKKTKKSDQKRFIWTSLAIGDIAHVKHMDMIEWKESS